MTASGCEDTSSGTAHPVTDASLRVPADGAVILGDLGPAADAAAAPDAREGSAPDAAGGPGADAATTGDALAPYAGSAGPPDAGGGADAHVGPRVHPEGYDDSDVHGPELKRGVGDCRTCHGAQLEGGRGPSCDACHEAGWRTNCTFCHGGTDTPTGAPPRDLDGVDDRAAQRFAPHTEHTTERNHLAWDCTQCHRKPADVMSAGHVFDETPGDAEVDFSGGLSPGATWDGNGQCGNVYCHGNGLVPGAVNHTAPRPNCDGCHVWFGLGGRHLTHFVRLIGCVACHNATADATPAIVGLDRHVNGSLDVVFETPEISFQGGTCNGSCHGEGHNNRGW